MKKLAILIFLCSLFLSSLHAQRSIADSVIAYNSISFIGSFQSPAGDLGDRFGNSTMIGGGYYYKTAKNWRFGLEGGFIFGNTVKESIAKNIRTADGNILDNQGNYVSMNLSQRGYAFTLSLAKILPVIGPNPNSGLIVSLGAGFLQHKILIETKDHEINLLQGEYLKGYDRLTNGLLIQEVVGYQHRSNNRRVNYTLGLEISQGLTESRRDYNFDLMKKDDTQRLDLLFGLRLGWSFLIYPSADTRKYYK